MNNIILTSFIIFGGLSSGAVVTAVSLSERIRHENMSVVKYTKLLVFCGVIGQVVITADVILMFVNEGYFLATIVSGICMEIISTILCIICVLMSCVWRITIEKEGFTHCNIFGVKRFYHYDDISCVVVRHNKYKIIVRGSKSVKFMYRMLGAQTLIDTLHSKNIPFTTKLTTR